MRILLSGVFNPSFEALPGSLATALRALGHSVTLYDHRASPLPGRIRRSSGVIDRLARALVNRRFLAATRRLRPDVVIVNQGMALEPATIAAVRETGARCVNWFSDYPAEFEEGVRAAPAYDAFFLASSHAVRRHHEAGATASAWLPFGCDRTLAEPAGAAAGSGPADPARVPPVVFVGSHYPERQILLRFLRGLDVGIWGPGWERAQADPHLRGMIRGGSLRPADWRRLYRGARVAVNIHYGCFGPRDVGGDLANTRVFEILACGGAVQLVDRQGDVLRLFEEGAHLAAFSSGDELRAAVERLLRDDRRRRALADRGRATVLEAHTYEHRAAVLLGTAVERRESPWRELPAAVPARQVPDTRGADRPRRAAAGGAR